MQLPAFTLHLGDCLESLRAMPDNSVDSIVTDPPYGLAFMGKRWDYDVPSVEIWAECLRVLKPGGHLLAFAGTRTQHRMAVRIEDGGFEIRDMIAWVYGSGFPKSRNLGEGWGSALKPALEPITVARKPFAGTLEKNHAAHGVGAYNIDSCRVPHGGEKLGGGNNSAEVDRSQKHEGWKRPWMEDVDAAEIAAERSRESTARSEFLGRWPANLIHDGSEEVLAGFPVTGASKSGGKAGPIGYHAGGNGADRGGHDDNGGSAARFFYCAKASKRDRDEGLEGFEAKTHKGYAGATISGRTMVDGEWVNTENERQPRANIHPTVKPTDLMAYLVRLVTPLGGLVLDPFMGSGSTGKAAMREGFNFIGCELSPEYLAIAEARIQHELAKRQRPEPPPKPQADLFAA